MPNSTYSTQNNDLILASLAAAFVALLLVANIIAVKLIGFGPWVVPAAIIVYPFTFLITDTIGEIYGKRAATRIIWIGFAVSLVMTVMVYLSQIIPPADAWAGQDAYESTLGAMPRIVAASMIAYLFSQHHDIFAFHFLRGLTRGKHLWLRNIASTAVSQAIDTLLFITIAFIGTVSTPLLVSLMVGQYIIKLIIAVLDTPLCYGLVWFIRKRKRCLYTE